MKNSIILLIVIITILPCCSEDFLNVVPRNTPTDGTYYQNESHAMASLTSCYDPITWPEFYGVWYLMTMDGASDDCLTEDPRFDRLAFTPDDPTVQDLYNIFYMGVARCNLFLQEIPGIPVSGRTKPRIIAEARFLRAFYYWHIVTTFGEAPLVTRVLSAEELKQPESPKEELWDQIEKDLLYAIEVLPEKSEYFARDMGRATRGAALSLLGKSHVYQERWEEARDLFTSLIASGEYELIQPIQKDSTHIYDAWISIFTPSPYKGYGGENNAESIFEIQFNSFIAGFPGGPYLGWGNAGTNRDVYLNSEPLGLGYDNLLPDQDFTEEFEPGDYRLTASVWRDGDTLDFRPGTRLYNQVFIAKRHAPRSGYTIKKTVYPIWYNFEASPNNWCVIRYADILLLYAECLYHLDEDPYPWINTVRARAGLPETTLPMPEALIHERRVELGFEGHRFRDLVRWSSPTIGWIEVEDHIPYFEKGKHEVLPIPQFEIDLSDGILEQNPGY